MPFLVLLLEVNQLGYIVLELKFHEKYSLCKDNFFVVSNDWNDKMVSYCMIHVLPRELLYALNIIKSIKSNPMLSIFIFQKDINIIKYILQFVIQRFKKMSWSV